MTRLFRGFPIGLLFIVTTVGTSAGEESVARRAAIVVKAVGDVSGGSAVAVRSGGGAAETVRHELDSSGSATLLLRPGSWSIEIQAAGRWSERRNLQVGEEDEGIEIRLLPAAGVVGRLRLPRGEAVPGEVRAEFRFVETRQAHLGIEKGSSTCPVGEDLRFDCMLPAGHVDIGLRARNFVTRWLWDRRLRPGGTADLGSIELVRGSSVSGWIEVTEGDGDPRDAALYLEPLGSIPGGDSPTVERDRQRLRLETRANRRGHFAFEGVPPGSYALLVELTGYAPLRRMGIPVVVDSESVIGSPLQLYRSRKLEVRVQPPLDSQGRDWTIHLRTLENPEAEALRAVMNEGKAVFDSIVPGRYSALLSDDGGIHRWWREVAIEPGQEELAIEVESWPVRGRVLFGDEGMPAELIFGGAFGMFRVRVTADEDGEFQVELPRGGNWPVDVRSATVQRRKWVRLPRERPKNGPVRVEIVVPDNVLAGRVVDTAGVPVEGAQVILYAPMEVRAEQSAADGAFVFRGIEEGEAVLAARLEPGRGSEEQRVTMRATGKVEGVDLIVVDRERLSGMVESATGGVPGAMVLAFVEDATGLRVLPEQVPSGRDGFFELSVPASAEQLRVAVLAPGFPLQVLQVPADPRIPVILPVSGGSGGELVLRPGLSEATVAPGSVAVFHARLPLDAGLLGMWARRNGSIPTEDELRVPRLEPGTYTVCTEIEPRDFVRLVSSGVGGSDRCRRVRVHEDDTTEVDLEDLED